MDDSHIIQLLILLFLLILSGFFSSAETALTTVSRIKIRTLAEEGNKCALLVEKIHEHYRKMLNTILIGNNIVNLSASSLATTFVISMWGNVYVGLATGILTFVILLAGEIVPKTWASLNAEKISLAYSGIIYYMMKIFTPVIFVVDILSNGILRLLHIDPDARNSIITENEIKTYVDVSHEDGQIETEERELIYNVFEFTDTCAKDIMIPRVNMVTIPCDGTANDLTDIFRNTMYTRIPVYQEEKDTMLGFINMKDFLLKLFQMQEAAERGEATEPITLEGLMRDAYYTFEYKKTADLLLEMRQKAVNVAFVLNEYGSTVGMITLEDLLEELVGEIRDEYDDDEKKLIQPAGEGCYLIAGSMNLSDINDALGTEIVSEEYDSIGGIIIGRLERIPEDEESVVLEDGTILQVKGMDENRILRVLLTLPPKPEEEASVASEE